jgi:hypothetical protein
MTIVDKELGRRLSPEEVASFLGIDPRVVKRHYAELGGVRLGRLTYLFFERRLVDALLQQAQPEKAMDGSDMAGREGKTEVIYRKKTSHQMGGRRKQSETLVDGHGIFG